MKLTEQKLREIIQSEIVSLNEGKNDYMARHSGVDIRIKDGYKSNDDNSLVTAYEKIGEFIQSLDLAVKSVEITVK